MNLEIDFHLVGRFFYLLPFFLALSVIAPYANNINRVVTAQGKQGIWFLLFPDRENTGNLVLTQGKICQHSENTWTMIINIKVCLFFLISKIFSLALLGLIINFKVLCIFVPTCRMS